MATPEPSGHPSSASWFQALVHSGWGERRTRMMILFPEAYWPQSLDLPRDKQYLSSVGYFFHPPFPIWPPLVPGAWKRGAPQPLSAVLMAQHIFTSPQSTPRPFHTRQLSWTHLWFLNLHAWFSLSLPPGQLVWWVPMESGVRGKSAPWPPSGGASCPAWCLLTWLLLCTL